MRKDNVKPFVFVTAAVMLVALAALIWLLDDWSLGGHTFQRIPTAVMLTAFFWAFFIRWGWKWPLLRKIFDRPTLGGTWIGHLQSDWTREDNVPATIVPIVFAIRQDFLSLHIQSFTADRVGLSDIAVLVDNKETGITYLSYIYALRDEFRAGQGHQQGAAELRLTHAKRQELRGEYWTNTKTRGRVLLRKYSSTLVHTFGEAAQKRAISEWPQFEDLPAR